MASSRVRGRSRAALDRWVSVGFVKDVRDLGGIWEQFTDKVANTPVVKQAREELVRATLKFTAPNAQPLKEDLDKLQAAYDLYLAVLKPGAASKTALDEFMKKASGMVSVAQQVQTIAAGLKANEANVNAATQEQSAIQNALKAAADAAAKAKQSTDGTQTGAEAASKALTQVSQINMSALLGQTQQLADAMWNLAQASQNVVQAPAARHDGRPGRRGLEVPGWRRPGRHGRDSGDALAGRGGHQRRLGPELRLATDRHQCRRAAGLP